MAENFIEKGIDFIGNKLDDMGIVGTAIQMADPTGITGYKDVKDSYENFKKDSSLANAGLLGLAALGALPMIGKIPKVLSKSKKLGKELILSREINKGVRDSKLSSSIVPAKTITVKDQKVLKSSDISTRKGQLEAYRDIHYKENMSGIPNFAFSQRAHVEKDGLYIGEIKLNADDLEVLGPAGVKKIISDLQDVSNKSGEFINGIGRNTSQQKAFEEIFDLMQKKYPKKIELPNGKITTEGSEKAKNLIFGKGQDFYSFPYADNPGYRVGTSQFFGLQYKRGHLKGRRSNPESRFYVAPEYEGRDLSDLEYKVINNLLNAKEEALLGIRNGDIEGFRRTYLGERPKLKGINKRTNVLINGVWYSKKDLKKIKITPGKKDHKQVFYRKNGKIVDRSRAYTPDEVLEMFEEYYEKARARRKNWERIHYPRSNDYDVNELLKTRNRIPQTDAEQLEQTYAEDKLRYINGNHTYFGNYAPYKLGGKLLKIKQFKQGGLINNLNKPKTWEEYQKRNRK